MGTKGATGAKGKRSKEESRGRAEKQKREKQNHDGHKESARCKVRAQRKVPSARRDARGASRTSRNSREEVEVGIAGKGRKKGVLGKGAKSALRCSGQKAAGDAWCKVGRARLNIELGSDRKWDDHGDRQPTTC